MKPKHPDLATLPHPEEGDFWYRFRDQLTSHNHRQRDRQQVTFEFVPAATEQDFLFPDVEIEEEP